MVQAIEDAGSSSIGRRSGALQWINGSSDSCFSFSFVCRILNRDPEEVRRLCERKAAARRRSQISLRDMLPQELFESPASRL